MFRTAWRTHVVLLAAAALGAMTGCRAADDRPATATTTGAIVTLDNDAALVRLTNVRCTHEVACGRVGPGRRYGDREACMTEVHRDARAAFGARACPIGIHAANLDECLADLHDDRCDNVVDSVERYLSCRRAKLCP